MWEYRDSLSVSRCSNGSNNTLQYAYTAICSSHRHPTQLRVYSSSADPSESYVTRRSSFRMTEGNIQGVGAIGGHGE
jgi:hypothetical protein